MEYHFEAREGVVAEGAVDEVPVGLVERLHVHFVVEHDGAGLFHVALNARTLEEDHLGVVVRVRANLELASLRTGGKTRFLIKTLTDVMHLERKNASIHCVSSFLTQT